MKVRRLKAPSFAKEAAPRNSNHKHLRKFTDEQLIELHHEGLMRKEVAKRLNVTPLVIYTHAKRLGLTWQRYGSRDSRVVKVPDDAPFISLIALAYIREDLAENKEALQP